MSEGLLVALMIGVSIIGGILYVGYNLHLQEQNLQVLRTSIPPHQRSHTQPAPPPRQILPPTPEERLAARQTSIDLALSSLETKSRDIRVYLNTKELARQTQCLNQAKIQQEYWKQYNATKGQQELPDLLDLVYDFAAPQYARAEVEVESTDALPLGMGVPHIPVGRRDPLPLLVGSRVGEGSGEGWEEGRGAASVRDPRVVHKVNDWFNRLAQTDGGAEDEDGDDRRSHFSL